MMKEKEVLVGSTEKIAMGPNTKKFCLHLIAALPLFFSSFVGVPYDYCYCRILKLSGRVDGTECGGADATTLAALYRSRTNDREQTTRFETWLTHHRVVTPG